MSESKSAKKSDEPIEVTHADSAANAADPPGADPRQPAEAVAQLQAEKDDLRQTLVRLQADFENYRKRVERDRQEESRRGVGRMMEHLLPVLDGFERALRAHDDPAYEEYRKGLELIYRQMWEALAKNGLERIAAAGKPFDPHFHQAIEQVETADYPDGSVVEVLQDGYLFHGRVLRPSIVRVAIASQGTEGKNVSPFRQTSQ